MAEAVLNGMKKASGWSIVLGILMIAAGLIAMVEPGVSGLFIALIVGWSAIFNGFASPAWCGLAGSAAAFLLREHLYFHT